MEAAADVVAHAAERHRAQRRAAPCRARRRRRCARARAAGTAARSAAETSARRRSRRGARRTPARNCATVRASASAPGTSADGAACSIARSCVGQRLGRLARPSSRSARQTRAISLQDVDEAGPAPPRRRRKVGAAVERLQLRRQPHAHRPAARSGRRLHERHVDAIDVGPLLAIDLDRHEVLVQHRRDRRRSRTTRAPSRGTSGTSSSRSTERSACPRARALRERLVAPRIPVDRIVRVLQQVRTALARQAIHQAIIMTR